MTTTGTATFNLDLNDLFEEAFERCGKEMRSGYDFRTARRSLNLLTIEWANRGINLWTIEQGSVPLVYQQASYDLPVDTIDLLDHVVRTGSGVTQQDINITRISSSTYLTIPNKTASGRPLQVWINRLSGQTDVYGSDTTYQPTITVWPVPDSSQTYTFVATRLRRMQDAGDGGSYTQDMPFRLVPAATAGLAYYLSSKMPEVDLNRIAMLKADYEQQWDLASQEDREKAALRIVPRNMFYYR